MTIQGAGMFQTIVDGSNNGSSVIEFSNHLISPQYYVSNMTVTGGSMSGVDFNNNGGSLTIESVNFFNNYRGYAGGINFDGNGTFGFELCAEPEDEYFSTLDIKNSLFDGNHGGIASSLHVFFANRVNIENCTFTNEELYNEYAYYALLCIDSSCEFNLINSIIWDNNIDDSPFTFNRFLILDFVNTSTVSHTLIEGGNDLLTSDWVEIETFNILDSNPLFTDPENGDFSLQPNSPCIDAGDPNSPLDPDGTIADMGAFYFDQNQSCSYSGDINEDELINILDIVLIVNIIIENEEPLESELCVADINIDGELNILDIVLVVNEIIG